MSIVRPAGNIQEILNAYAASGTKSGTELKESETLTAITPGGEAAGECLQIPANYMGNPGQGFRWYATGQYEIEAEPKLTLGLYYATGAQKIAEAKVLASITITCKTIAAKQGWEIDLHSRLVSTGTTGKILTQGCVHGFAPAQVEGTGTGSFMVPLSATGGNEVAIDTTLESKIYIGAKFSTKVAKTNITCFQWWPEALN